MNRRHGGEHTESPEARTSVCEGNSVRKGDPDQGGEGNNDFKNARVLH